MHTSPSGKSYIGQTFQYQRRCLEHQRESGCTALYNAIKKYGWNNFKHEILKDDLTLEEANFWEKFYIAKYNTIKPNGYNLRTGGDNSLTHESTKIKIGKANSGKKRSEKWIKMIKEVNTGRTHPQEIKDKIAKGNKGRIVSEETKLKLSRAIAEKMKDPIYKAKCSKGFIKKGHIKTDAQKAASSKANKERWIKYREEKICQDKS